MGLGYEITTGKDQKTENKKNPSKAICLYVILTFLTCIKLTFLIFLTYNISQKPLTRGEHKNDTLRH